MNPYRENRLHDEIDRAERERHAVEVALAEMREECRIAVEAANIYAKSLGEALNCAQHLAMALWEKHYKNDAPHWTVGDDLVLVISQIDNMTAGLARAFPRT